MRNPQTFGSREILLTVHSGGVCGRVFCPVGHFKQAAVIIGPMSYGLVNFWRRGNHLSAILSTLIFFVAGLGMLMTVNEQRGRVTALSD